MDFSHHLELLCKFGCGIWSANEVGPACVLFWFLWLQTNPPGAENSSNAPRTVATAVEILSRSYRPLSLSLSHSVAGSCSALTWIFGGAKHYRRTKLTSSACARTSEHRKTKTTPLTGNLLSTPTPSVCVNEGFTVLSYINSWHSLAIN